MNLKIDFKKTQMVTELQLICFMFYAISLTAGFFMAIINMRVFIPNAGTIIASLIIAVLSGIGMSYFKKSEVLTEYER